jgi:hypothetical protein
MRRRAGAKVCQFWPDLSFAHPFSRVPRKRQSSGRRNLRSAKKADLSYSRDQMKIALIGDNETCKGARTLLRQAGFAVREMPARSDVRIWIEEHPRIMQIYFDSMDAPLETAVIRHVSRLSRHPIVIDRPGGVVQSDRELRIVVPEDSVEQQHAVQLGVLRGLLDFSGARRNAPFWKKLLGAT